MIYFSFSLYFLLFMLIEAHVNECAAFVFGAGYVNPIYAAGLLATAAGYLLCLPWVERFRKRSLRLILSVPALILLLLLCRTQFLQKNPALFLLIALLSLILLGIVGGLLHADLSLFVSEKYFGLKLGLSMSTAILLQYLVQMLPGKAPVYYVLYASLLFLFLRDQGTMARKVSGGTAASENEEKTHNLCPSGAFSPQEKEHLPLRYFLYPAAIVGLMSAALGLQDSIMVIKNAAGEIALFSGIRLFYALSLLLSGLLISFCGAQIFRLVCLIVMLLSTAAISFSGGNSLEYSIGMGLMYFYSGFYVIFLTYEFLCLASQKNRPSYAGLGRAVRSIVTAFVVLLMLPFGDQLNLYALIVLECLTGVGLVLLFVFGGYLSSQETDSKTAPASETSRDLLHTSRFTPEKYNEFYETYLLTERERDVFVPLITTEKEAQEIADELGISRRVFQRHVASIYEKTGVSSRVGLLYLFTGEKTEAQK